MTIWAKANSITCLQKETTVILGYMKETKRCIKRSFNCTTDKIILPFLASFRGQRRTPFFIHHIRKTQGGLRKTKGERLEISVRSLLLPRLAWTSGSYPEFTGKRKSNLLLFPAFLLQDLHPIPMKKSIDLEKYRNETRNNCLWTWLKNNWVV